MNNIISFSEYVQRTREAVKQQAIESQQSEPQIIAMTPHGVTIIKTKGVK